MDGISNMESRYRAIAPTSEVENKNPVAFTPLNKPWKRLHAICRYTNGRYCRTNR